MRFPFVQESYLEEWLNKNAKLLNLGSQRFPRLGKGQRVRRGAAKGFALMRLQMWKTSNVSAPG